MVDVYILPADVIRVALAMLKPRPSVEMYPGDWLRDPISGCSLAANGFWWRATMTMHDAKPYGHMVANNGQPLTERQIIQRCGCRSVGEYRKVLAEIETFGIPGRTCDADYLKIFDADPIEVLGAKWKMDLSPLAIEQADVIYSRRMIRDRILSLVRFLVSPRAKDLFPPLNVALKVQTPAFDRVRAGDARKTEEEEGSPFQSSQEPGEGCGGRVVAPDFETVAQVVSKIDQSALRTFPSEQLVVAWVGKYGAELVLETLIDAEDGYRGKGYQYFAEILQTRHEDPSQRPGRRKRSGNGKTAPLGAPGAMIGKSTLDRMTDRIECFVERHGKRPESGTDRSQWNRDFATEFGFTPDRWLEADEDERWRLSADAVRRGAA